MESDFDASFLWKQTFFGLSQRSWCRGTKTKKQISNVAGGASEIEIGCESFKLSNFQTFKLPTYWPIIFKRSNLQTFKLQKIKLSNFQTLGFGENWSLTPKSKIESLKVWKIDESLKVWTSENIESLKVCKFESLNPRDHVIQND